MTRLRHLGVFLPESASLWHLVWILTINPCPVALSQSPWSCTGSFASTDPPVREAAALPHLVLHPAQPHTGYVRGWRPPGRGSRRLSNDNGHLFAILLSALFLPSCLCPTCIPDASCWSRWRLFPLCKCFPGRNEAISFSPFGKKRNHRFVSCWLVPIVKSSVPGLEFKLGLLQLQKCCWQPILRGRH